ncbi:hypothetical protein [Nocardia macrotermitis]|uniref:Uncharacterized protein n=1 Tax=Nocardia macrotermitis TaxID=2585198 RepID=A0A7K0DC84_9NOCA|nr:hypothetical protein [Nocardia macrotermitis]MQY23390.1 hypothetical protein [Nocardia macrotermitis]
MTSGEHPDLPAAVADSAIFGTPHQTPDGATVITVAQPGGRFRRGPRPLGAIVVQGGESKWIPATDDTRITLLALLIGLSAATLSCLAVVRRPPWPQLNVTVSKCLQ